MLCKGYKNRSRWAEKKSDVNSDTADVIMEKIRAGLTGDPAKDRAFLKNQILSYSNHPLEDDIFEGCEELLANTLSADELVQWAEEMCADDMRGYDAQEKQTVPIENEDPSETMTTEWETTERVNSDGSKIVTHINNRTNAGVIQELDPQGNMVCETFGRFEEAEQLSREELEDRINKASAKQMEEEIEAAELHAKEIRAFALQTASDMKRLADGIGFDTIHMHEAYDMESAQKMADILEDIRYILCQNADELVDAAHILERTLELPQETTWDSSGNAAQNLITCMNKLPECHCELQDRIMTASNKIMMFVIKSRCSAFFRDYVPALEACQEKIDKVKNCNAASLEKISAFIALMEQQEEQKKAAIKIEENVRPDGSRVVTITDQDAHKVEIHMFDAEAESVEQASGDFEPIELISDEESDEYTADRNHNYK